MKYMQAHSLVALLTLGLVAVASVGCDKKQPTESDTPNQATTTAAADSAQSKAQLELTDDDVPVPEDFIEESTKQITDDNYKDELSKLEGEINSDNE